jgi:hypothetical protein
MEYLYWLQYRLMQLLRREKLPEPTRAFYQAAYVIGETIRSLRMEKHKTRLYDAYFRYRTNRFTTRQERRIIQSLYYSGKSICVKSVVQALIELGDVDAETVKRRMSLSPTLYMAYVD